MPIAELLAEAGAEVATALSLRSGLGHLPEDRPTVAARKWLLRISAAGLLLALAAWGMATLLTGPARRVAALMLYAGLSLALIAALGWASLFAATRPPGGWRGRGA
jgi:hypothetical protein